MRAVAYCRYSSDRQREESIDAQIFAIKEFCQKNNYKLLKIYTDMAVSGKSDERTNFLNMISDASKNTFDLVIVHKLDRFARNRYDSAVYKKKLLDNNIRVISVLEHLDASPESVILESVLEGMSEYYSKNLARETLKGLRENAKKSHFNGGFPPLGYSVNQNKEYIINEYESKIVKKVFELYLLGLGYSKIASKLNSLGFHPRKKSFFSKATVRDILLQEKYIGTYIFEKKAITETRIENTIPAIISKQDWEKVQEKMKNNTHKPKFRKNKFYLLTGLMKCGICGSSFTGYTSYNNQKKQYNYYSCSGKHNKTNDFCKIKSIPQEEIEEKVLLSIKNLFTDNMIETLSTTLYKNLQNNFNSVDKDIDEITKKIKSYENKIQKTLDLFEEDIITKEKLKERIAEHEENIKILQKELFELQSKKLSKISKEEIKKFLIDSKNNLESKNPLLIRKIIEIFIESIVVDENSIEIKIRVSPPDGTNSLFSTNFNSSHIYGAEGGT